MLIRKFIVAYLYSIFSFIFIDINKIKKSLYDQPFQHAKAFSCILSTLKASARPSYNAIRFISYVISFCTVTFCYFPTEFSTFWQLPSITTFSYFGHCSTETLVSTMRSLEARYPNVVKFVMPIFLIRQTIRYIQQLSQFVRTHRSKFTRPGYSFCSILVLTVLLVGSVTVLVHLSDLGFDQQNIFGFTLDWIKTTYFNWAARYVHLWIPENLNHIEKIRLFSFHGLRLIIAICTTIWWYRNVGTWTPVSCFILYIALLISFHSPTLLPDVIDNFVVKSLHSLSFSFFLELAGRMIVYDQIRFSWRTDVTYDKETSDWRDLPIYSTGWVAIGILSSYYYEPNMWFVSTVLFYGYGLDSNIIHSYPYPDEFIIVLGCLGFLIFATKDNPQQYPFLHAIWTLLCFGSILICTGLIYTSITIYGLLLFLKLCLTYLNYAQKQCVQFDPLQEGRWLTLWLELFNQQDYKVINSLVTDIQWDYDSLFWGMTVVIILLIWYQDAFRDYFIGENLRSFVQYTINGVRPMRRFCLYLTRFYFLSYCSLLLNYPEFLQYLLDEVILYGNIPWIKGIKVDSHSILLHNLLVDLNLSLSIFDTLLKLFLVYTLLLRFPIWVTRTWGTLAGIRLSWYTTTFTTIVFQAIFFADPLKGGILGITACVIWLVIAMVVLESCIRWVGRDIVNWVQRTYNKGTLVKVIFWYSMFLVALTCWAILTCTNIIITPVVCEQLRLLLEFYWL